jgi:hypothetical protein
MSSAIMDSGEGSKAAKSDRNSNSKSRGKSPKQRGKSPKRTKSGSGVTAATTSDDNTSSSTHNTSSNEDADRSFSNHCSVRDAMKRDATLSSKPLPPLPLSLQDGDGHDNAHSNNMTAETVLDVIPPECLHDPQGAEPSLHCLPKVVASSILAQTPHQQRGTNTTSNAITNSNAAGKFPTLRTSLEAAQDDIRSHHRARQQAGSHRHAELLRSHKLGTDPLWISRQQRLNELACRWCDLCGVFCLSEDVGAQD